MFQIGNESLPTEQALQKKDRVVCADCLAEVGSAESEQLHMPFDTARIITTGNLKVFMKYPSVIFRLGGGKISAYAYILERVFAQLQCSALSQISRRCDRPYHQIGNRFGLLIK